MGYDICFTAFPRPELNFLKAIRSDIKESLK